MSRKNKADVAGSIDNNEEEREITFPDVEEVSFARQEIDPDEDKYYPSQMSPHITPDRYYEFKNEIENSLSRSGKFEIRKDKLKKGIKYGWISYGENGDTSEAQSARGRGWKPVPPEWHPELVLDIFGDEKAPDRIRRNRMELWYIPLDVYNHIQHKKHERNLAHVRQAAGLTQNRQTTEAGVQYMHPSEYQHLVGNSKQFSKEAYVNDPTLNNFMSGYKKNN